MTPIRKRRSVTPSVYERIFVVTGVCMFVVASASAAVGIGPVPKAIGLVDPRGADCARNCDTSGPVTSSDLLTMMNIALGNHPISACSAGDSNRDERVTIDEVLDAMNNAVNGCHPTPTRTSTIPRLPIVVVPTPGARLADVTIVNPGINRRAHQTIEVVGSEIASIQDAPSVAAAAISPFSGTYVLPGLIDMHVHYPYGILDQDVRLFNLLYLAHGVTTVRDTGNFDRSIFRNRDRINAGQVPGPRIFACGTILDGQPPVWPGSCVVTNADEARECVRQQADAGASWIKVYELLSAPALTAIEAEAGERRLPIIGHVPQAVPFEKAFIHDVQHLTGFPAVQYRGDVSYMDWWVPAWAGMSDERIEFIVRTSVEQGIAHTPTLTLWHRLSAGLADYDRELNDPTAHLLPTFYRCSTDWNPQMNPKFRARPETIAQLPTMLDRLGSAVSRLYAAGVSIHAGTDVLNPFVVPGASLHEELQHLVESGLTVEQAWAAATQQSGAVLPEPGIGVVVEGARADLLIFREDPTRDLNALATLEAVIAEGRLYRVAELRAAAVGFRDYIDRRSPRHCEASEQADHGLLAAPGAIGADQPE